MFDRLSQKQPFRYPKGMVIPSCAALTLEHMYHNPGQAAAIRYFDPASTVDYEAIREILRGKQVKKWMDDTHNLSKSEYREWAGTRDHNNFLFAVLDARTSELSNLELVRGFVYIYSERSEKFRVKRMERQGFLQPAKGERFSLEVSFALKPLGNGEQVGSGLMSSALRQSCLQVQQLLDSPKKPEIYIFAFVDPDNSSAHRTLEASGFVRKGLMQYDWDSPNKSYLYSLSWRLLHKKVRRKLLEL